MGPGQTKVPDQAQDLNLGGELKVSDIVGADATIKWNGNNGEMTGEAKFVSDFSAAFGKDEQVGHFVPISLDKKFKGKQLKLSGRIDGDRTVTISDDLLMVVRLENLTAEKKLTAANAASKATTPVFTIDFSKMTLDVPMKVLPQEHNLGKYGKLVSELVGPDAAIAADGAVTGELKHITEPWEENHNRTGYFLPVRLDAPYKDKPVTVQRIGGDPVTATEEDWILTVIDKDTEISFKDGDVEFMHLTCKNAQFDS